LATRGVTTDVAGHLLPVNQEEDLWPTH